jgi:hypothetical protein
VTRRLADYSSDLKSLKQLVNEAINLAKKRTFSFSKQSKMHDPEPLQRNLKDVVAKLSDAMVAFSEPWVQNEMTFIEAIFNKITREISHFKETNRGSITSLFEAGKDFEKELDEVRAQV